MRYLLSALLLLGSCPAALAQDITFEGKGYADLRAVLPSDQRSWMDGGLGKLRFGGGEGNSELRLGEIVGQGRLQLTPELMALAVGRIEQDQRTFVDILEAYLRYRPVSTTPWRWSVKLGALFPPISLENTDLGWTSPWTLTPSAINSWVGEELRTIGGEVRLEWRRETGTITATGAIFGWNDPAGIMLADRGWDFSDRPTGLLDRLRLPDVVAHARHLPVPLHTLTFSEIDGSPGWYAGLSWEETGLGRIQILRYNNEADPSAYRTQFAWRTDFWSAGVETHFGNVALLAQGMSGTTLIVPSPTFYSETIFKAAYLLAGWDIDEWRLAGRFDVFSTEEDHPGPSVSLSEHGSALTFAVNWLRYDWLRLTGEVLRVDSTREQRVRAGLPPHAIENQIQFSARIFF